MTGVYVTVPVACFRKGLAREYLETEDVPPPSTCYGFLLSLVGETDRNRHIGARVTCCLLRSEARKSVVLRTVWRVKNKPLGSSGNTRPDYQQLLTGIELVIWLDSADETHDGDRLETRVATALDPRRRGAIRRFGGLSLGESTHMVDEVTPIEPQPDKRGRAFLLADRGCLTLPVWVDHVGSKGTRYETGDLVEAPLVPPDLRLIPQIRPPDHVL